MQRMGSPGSAVPSDPRLVRRERERDNACDHEDMEGVTRRFTYPRHSRELSKASE